MHITVAAARPSRFPAVGGPPFDFVVEYDQSMVSERMTYSLRARIEAGRRLLFTSTNHIPAFTTDLGEPIRLTRVGGPHTAHRPRNVGR